MWGNSQPYLLILSVGKYWRKRSICYWQLTRLQNQCQSNRKKKKSLTDFWAKIYSHLTLFTVPFLKTLLLRSCYLVNIFTGTNIMYFITKIDRLFSWIIKIRQNPLTNQVHLFQKAFFAVVNTIWKNDTFFEIYNDNSLIC